MSRRFTRFACIDWSGARGERQKGIALAVADNEEAPRLIERPKGWSRPAILNWLIAQAAAGEDMLIGIDFSTALPFLDCGAYFPGWNDSPTEVQGLWKVVDEMCAGDPHLAVDTLIDHPDLSRHFRRHGGRQGDLFGTENGRLRIVERRCREGRHGPAVSGFNLVGAAQVGKSTLTGMRMLNRLKGIVPVWPYGPIPEHGPVIVEIYTTIAARRAGMTRGSKMRDKESLARALATFGVSAVPELELYDDHSTDALLTAAWLRDVADDSALWKPDALAPEIVAREGWTFGVP